MKNYDVIVIGSGRGLSVARSAASEGLSTALVDRGPLGGTCLNNGCIPSKFLIAAADRVMDIAEASDYGIAASVEEVDYTAVVAAMRRYVTRHRESRRDYLDRETGIDFYEEAAEFTSARELRAGGETLRGERIFVAAGSRPTVPDIAGLDDVRFHTNETVLDLEEPPRSMIIVGGGYVGVEYAHFFSAMGVEVVLVDTGDRLLKREEPEIGRLLTERLAERVDVRLRTRPVRAARERGRVLLTCERDGGDPAALEADALMLAAGRRSNADLLRVERAGIETDDRGFIRVDDRFATSAEAVWAFGDIIGKAMFTHAGGVEASIAFDNAVHGAAKSVDYGIVPHAVFTRPPVASVGLTEAEALRRRFDVLVGRADYADTVKGAALRQQGTFAKAVVNAADRRILGFHVVGPQAPVLIQEVTALMAAGRDADRVSDAMHIHPALSELVPAAFASLKPAGTD